MGLAGRAASDARTDFQRDFDRIVFSSAFRRLQDKTQVFPLSKSDYVRTRLTHSLEVSSVGRTLGTRVGEHLVNGYRLKGVYPHDIGAVVAAACLAHDIGNPPFGHAGEDAIRHWFARSATGQAALSGLDPAERQDLLNFEGNAQGFRLLARLQSPDNSGGMQLTYTTLGAFSKYPRASRTDGSLPVGAGFRKFGFVQADRLLFAEVGAALELPQVAAWVWQRHPLAYLVEAADDICYRIIDIEDAFRLGHLSYRDADDLLGPLASASRGDELHRRLASIAHRHEKIAYLRARAIGAMVDQTQNCFIEQLDAIVSGRFEGELLDQIASARPLRALKDYAEQHIYVADSVVTIGVAGYRVLGGLLEAFMGAVLEYLEAPNAISGQARMLLQLLPDHPNDSDNRPPTRYQHLLRVTDFIAGMTDSYAVNLYKNITGISLPGNV